MPSAAWTTLEFRSAGGGMPGSTRLVLPGEGVYYGEANSDSQRHGRGKLWTIDGRLFDGEWTAGAKHGRGVEIYTDRRGNGGKAF